MKKTVIEGDVTMMRDLINRIDGMPVQRLAGHDGEAIQINVINYGSDHSSQLSTESVSTTLIESTSEIQDSSDPSTRGEIEDSIERTDSKDST